MAEKGVVCCTGGGQRGHDAALHRSHFIICLQPSRQYTNADRSNLAENSLAVTPTCHTQSCLEERLNIDNSIKILTDQ